MKISMDEARKQKESMERHLCDQIQVFEERTGLRVRSLDLIRVNSVGIISSRVIGVSVEVLL